MSLWPPTGAEVLFGLLGLVTVAAALFSVLTTHLVHAALGLVVALGGVAGCFLVMTAEFVAWVQVLIYVGAVVVLLVFGLMLTRAPIGPSDDADSSARIPALLTALAAGAALLVLLVQSFRDVDLVLDAPGGGSAESIGQALFAHWVLPFELLSVLLLGALVGAIALSRRDDGGSG